MFADNSTWHKQRGDQEWDVFLPALQDFNAKQKPFVKPMLLMLDESMPAWCPKTSKTGGLPNTSYEPRKPEPLSTMLRNFCKCITWCLMYQDPVMWAEVQDRKDFFCEDKKSIEVLKSGLPYNANMAKHTAKVCHQIQGSGLEKGGWIGGDAWFGPWMNSVEAKLRFGVDTTFVIKTHKKLFPMNTLAAVIMARHGSHPAGH